MSQHPGHKEPTPSAKLAVDATNSLYLFRKLRDSKAKGNCNSVSDSNILNVARVTTHTCRSWMPRVHLFIRHIAVNPKESFKLINSRFLVDHFAECAVSGQTMTVQNSQRHSSNIFNNRWSWQFCCYEVMVKRLIRPAGCVQHGNVTWPSPYCAVNTFHPGYKNQSVYAVSGTSRCLFSDNRLKTKRRRLYLKTQSVPRCKHFISVIKTNQFML